MLLALNSFVTATQCAAKSRDKVGRVGGKETEMRTENRAEVALGVDNVAVNAQLYVDYLFGIPSTN